MKTAAPLALAAFITWSGNTALGQGTVLERARATFQPLPAQAQEVARNLSPPARIELGKMLYFEPRLSSSWVISCNSCHNIGLGGVDLQETSIGHGWQRGRRNTPTVFNAVLNIAQSWDGRVRSLKEEAKQTVQAAVDMNSTPERTMQTLKSIPEYVRRFAQAFPGDSAPVTFDNMARAIEAFETTLLTPGAPFDRYLAGDTSALNAVERQGLTLFMDRGCARCHAGVNIGGAAYFPFGVVERPGADILPPTDKGRFEVSRTATDEYVFKAPSLRNVALTPPYFHSGVVWNLEQAVAVMGSAQIGTELTPAETSAITAFLRTLTGEQPKIDYPVLPAMTKDTPLPDLSPSARPARAP
jgi:cytochrome c peroxidase